MAENDRREVARAPLWSLASRRPLAPESAPHFPRLVAAEQSSFHCREEGGFERLPRPELEEFFDVGKHGMYGEGHAPLRFIRFAISFETRRH